MSKASQRYDIYVNEKQLILLDESELSKQDFIHQALVMPYKGQQKTLFQYLDLLEQSNRFSIVVLYAVEAKAIMKDLKELMLNISAAGGVIENNEEELLLIFRRKVWDLPKGKLDKNEPFELAAIRECCEETGLNNLILKEKIVNTYHFFRDLKNNRCLKKTKWYYIKCYVDQLPVPQLEEDIETAIWIKPSQIFNKKPMFANITLVLNKFVELKENLAIN
ncbi:MAG: NUDIX domain-containing protein [Saprospiraceae bacterium]